MKLGQHFIKDQAILARMIELADIRPTDIVLEVGGGLGDLTYEISKRAEVTTVEKDQDLAQTLLDRFSGNNAVHIIHGDILQIDLPAFNKCVSNLPYLISRPFVIQLIEHGFERAVLLLQEEFAQKLAAPPGDKRYRAISAYTQASCSVHLSDRVPRSAFKPHPRVDSRIVVLDMFRPSPPHFIHFLNLMFQKRRKRLGGKRVCDFSPQELLEMFLSIKKQELNRGTEEKEGSKKWR